ncbi:hypothetical protein T484DRAFT_1841920 [Baffinella frigidus]|nr:hypothetical protein T484DRAFT_1841920 [Cryptophyta sp. CCMP2293]|mmetsp:Transcript_41982/g.98925  ORF Transcript_41982/g.98925 Transcript_41982/m.98925 type:complete len:191 (+) Transcript_41982:90-662(+)
MGGSCSTVSAKTRMANQLRDSKGDPGEKLEEYSWPPKNDSAPGGTGTPTLAVYNSQHAAKDAPPSVSDVIGGSSSPPGRTRRVKSPGKERVVGVARAPRRASVAPGEALTPDYANLGRAQVITESRAGFVSDSKALKNLHFDQQEARRHRDQQKADRKASAASGNPEIAANANARRTSVSRSQSPQSEAA